MNRAILNGILATGIVALTATLAPPSATASPADGNYVGTWVLTGWNVDGTDIDCPGKLPVPPPAPAIECGGGEFLKLTKGSRYRSNLSVFRTQLHPKGDFGVLQLPNSPTRTIVFYSDTARRDPRAYNLEVTKGRGGRDSMVISLEFSAGAGKDSLIEMIFSRKAS